MATSEEVSLILKGENSQLQTTLNESKQSMNALEAETQKAGNDIDTLSAKSVNVNTAPAEANLNSLGAEATETKDEIETIGEVDFGTLTAGTAEVAGGFTAMYESATEGSMKIQEVDNVSQRYDATLATMKGNQDLVNQAVEESALKTGLSTTAIEKGIPLLGQFTTNNEQLASAVGTTTNAMTDYAVQNGIALDDTEAFRDVAQLLYETIAEGSLTIIEDSGHMADLTSAIGLNSDATKEQVEEKFQALSATERLNAVNDVFGTSVESNTGFIGILNGALSQMRTFIDENAVALTIVGLLMGAFAVAVGIATLASSGLGAIISGGVTLALETLGGAIVALFSPMGLLVAGIVFLVVAIIQVGIQTGALAEFMATLQSAIQPVVEAIAGLIGVIVQVVVGLFTWITTNQLFIAIVQVLFTILGQLATIIGQVIAIIVNAITAVIQWIATNETLQAILSLVANIIMAVVLVIGQLISKALEIISNFIQWISTNETLHSILQSVKTIIEGVINIIGQLIQIVFNAIKSFVEWIATSETLHTIIGVVINIIQVIIGIIGTLIGIVYNAVASFLNWIATNETLHQIIQLVIQIIGQIIGIIGQLIGFVGSVIASIVNWIATNETLHAIIGVIINVIQAWIGIIMSVIGVIVDIIGKIGNWISESEILQSALQFVSDVIDKISSAISTLIGWIEKVIGWFGKLADAATDALSNIPFIGGLFDGESASLAVVPEVGAIDDLSQNSLVGSGFIGRQGIQRTFNNSQTKIEYNITPEKVMSIRDAHREKIRVNRHQNHFGRLLT